MNIATDGETFGHHSKFGDMALAYAIDKIERLGLARITNYSEYLAASPSDPRSEDIREHFVELLSRSRAVAKQLRMQQRQHPLSSTMASAAATGARCAARKA